MGDAHCAHKENGCWCSRTPAREFGELDSLFCTLPYPDRNRNRLHSGKERVL